MRSRASRRDRMEREAQARRARARAHLERVRGGRVGAGRDGPRIGRLRLEGALRLGGERPRAGILAALFAAAAGAGLWLGDDALAAATSAPWRVSRLAVRGAERLPPLEVARASGVDADQSWAAVDPEAVVRALEDHDWIASARAARLPGGILVLDVTERRPAAVTWIGEAAFAVDAEGRPFAPLDAEEAGGLPRLSPATPPAPREPHAGLARAIAVARALPAQGLALPREVTIADEGDPAGLALRLPGLAAEFVLGAEAPERRIAALAELLERRPAEVAEAARVDLRFEDQAVLSGRADPEGEAQEAAWRGGAATSERQPRG